MSEKITPNQTFIHDRQRYEVGETYEVAPELAYYFKTCGWVGEGAPATSKPATLNIQDGGHGQTSEVK